LTDCAELRPLVEKLHDFEATPAEKLAAEAHLEECPGCRSHLEFLLNVAEQSRSMTYHEPPESYWDHLPGRILERIDSEGRRPPGFLSLLLAPPVLRWAGLGATLVLVAAVGVSLFREEPGASAPPPASASLRDPAPLAIEERTVPEEPDTPSPAAPPAQARSNEVAEAPPPMARDEKAEKPDSEPEAAEESAEARESEEAGLAFDAASVPESAVVLSKSENEAQSASKIESERRAEVATLAANRARGAAAPDRLARVAIESCEALRRKAASLGATREGADARYHLAICSLLRHEQDGTDPLEVLAVEDAEAFLELEPQGARAEEIRERVRRMRLN
jgi:hypothetical protein